ncbi:MAG: YcaO-like family protein [Eubacterium sp.]|nr:YcaO-like family protein [Eubacterium sp.]
MKNGIYKDSDVSDTINRIKSILQRNNIIVEEKIDQGYDGIYSVRLTIKELSLGTNGKGTTENNALASAYGELMERIQNFALYKFTYPDVYGICETDFYYAPDEKKYSVNNFCKLISIFGNGIDTHDYEKLLYIRSSYEIRNNNVVCIPYKKINSCDVIDMPAKLVDAIYASNGMAAGNTISEALVQAISEVFERFANRIICDGKITPPQIPIEKIGFSSEMISIINSIKEKGDYDIVFKDCSIGLGLPVVALYFIDKAAGKYFVKFGAHPILRIAAERTMTELFQGRKLITSNRWLKDFSFESCSDQFRNFEKIFRSGDGKYPFNIFKSNYTYELTSSWYDEHQLASNNDLLNYLVEIINRNHWTMLYRDVSFLGFPTVHVIIPEISFINVIGNEYINKYIYYEKVKSIMRNIHKCGEQELFDLINFIDNNFYSSFDSILPLTGLPLNNDSFLSKMNNLYFKFLLFAKTRKYKEALENIDKYIVDNHLLNSVAGVKYRCFREAFYSLKIMNNTTEQTKDVLLKVYDEKIINPILKILSEGTFLEEIDRINCFNCSKCDSNFSCRMLLIADFHKKICAKYSEWNGEIYE